MSDYNSSLPIRTENNGDVVSKIADATIPNQQLAVEADGSINVNAAFAPGTEVKITDGTETVDVSTSNELQVKDDDAIALLTTIDADTSNLDVALSTRASESTLSTLNAKFVSGTDIGDVTINNGAAGAAVNIQDGGNSITVDGSVTVSATDLDIRDLVFATDTVDVSGSEVSLDATTLAALESITVQNGAGASAVNIQDGGNSLTVDATDLDIRDLTHASDSVKVGDGTEFLAVNTDGSINVVMLNDVPGTEICDYQTSASVASSASVNHDYTVTAAKTFTAEEAVISASSKIKVQILFNAVTKFVAFNSTANPVIVIPMLRLIKAAATQVVRITITNLDNQSQDVYSTLLGEETP